MGCTLCSPQSEKLDAIIGKARKQFLGFRVSTDTDKPSLHNTADDLIEAHLWSQRLRLGITSTGRILFSRLGLTSPRRFQTSQIISLLHDIKEKLFTALLPQNMQAVRNTQCREARAKAIYTCYGKEPTTAQPDVSSYPSIRATRVVVVQHNKHVTNPTPPGYGHLQAEKTVTALAITQTTAKAIITDLQKACRNFSCR